MSAPKVWLDPDGRGFYWKHECEPYDEAVLARLDDPESAAWYRKQRSRARLLPIGEKGWTIEQVEPLTLTPSILCGTCKIHGWWRDGEWQAV